jgi:hypothetical protein
MAATNRAVYWVVGGIILAGYLAWAVREGLADAHPAPHPSPAAAQQAVEQPRPQPRLVIRFDELVCYNTRGGMPVVEGTLRNIGDVDARMLSIRAKLYSPDGEMVGYAEGHAAVAPLARGQRSPFKALSRVNREIAACEVDSVVSRGEQALLAGTTTETALVNR